MEFQLERKKVMVLFGVIVIVGISIIGLVILFPPLLGLFLPVILIIGLVYAFLPFIGLAFLGVLVFYFMQSPFSTRHTSASSWDPVGVHRGTREEEMINWHENVDQSDKKHDHNFRHSKYRQQ